MESEQLTEGELSPNKSSVTQGWVRLMLPSRNKRDNVNSLPYQMPYSCLVALRKTIECEGQVTIHHGVHNKIQKRCRQKLIWQVNSLRCGLGEYCSKINAAWSKTRPAWCHVVETKRNKVTYVVCASRCSLGRNWTRTTSQHSPGRPQEI